MDQLQSTTPPRPTIPVPPNAPKKQLPTYKQNHTHNVSASRVLVFE
jgi:hypothetical protein